MHSWEEKIEDAVRLGFLNPDSKPDDILEFVEEDESFLSWCDDLILEHRDEDEVSDLICVHLLACVRLYARDNHKTADR